MPPYPQFSQALGFLLADNVGFSRRNVQPPADRYIDQSTSIVVRSFSLLGPVPIVIRARILTPKGEIANLEYTHTTAAVGAMKDETFPLREGFLLSVLMGGAETTLTQASVYVSVALANAIGGAFTLAQPLFTDYIDNVHWVGWPGGRQLIPREGPGNLITLGPISSTGADLTESLLSMEVWRIYSVRVRLVTDATAVMRRVGFGNFIGGTLVRAFYSTNFLQGASATTDYYFTCNITETSTGTPSSVFLNIGDPYYVEAGGIKTDVINLQAGDQLEWFVQREEWIEATV